MSDWHQILRRYASDSLVQIQLRGAPAPIEGVLRWVARDGCYMLTNEAKTEQWIFLAPDVVFIRIKP